MNERQALQKQKADNRELIKSLLAQVAQLEKENFQLDLKLKSHEKEEAVEEEKVGEVVDKKTIREKIFEERPRRSRNFNLPENDSSLTMLKRQENATVKRKFRA